MARTAIFTRFEIISPFDLSVTKAAKNKIVQIETTMAAKILSRGCLKTRLKEFTFIYIVFYNLFTLAPAFDAYVWLHKTKVTFFMKHLKKSCILLMLLTVIIGSRTLAQDLVASLNLFYETKNSDRAKEVVQNNEYTFTGYEMGIFYANPLMLNGKPLDYSAFNVKLKGELIVIKGAVLTGRTIQVPFYVYLKRNGKKVPIFRKAGSDQKQIKIEISEILRYAKPGDQLVIEAVRKEDGPVKRILKLLEGGC
jgi:hypothetical protein